MLQLFEIKEKKKKVPVAGCRCTQGILQKSKNFKLVRNDEVIIDGRSTVLSIKYTPTFIHIICFV